MDALLFQPLLKRLVWGGRRLGELLGKPLGEASDYAESWEIVDHGSDQSVVSEGPLRGKSLGQLLRELPGELLGRDARHETFPLLYKFLDCQRVLSVQVHPNDEYASRMAVPDLGKTEAWYVVDAQPGSLIYAGLKQGVDAATLERAMLAGKVDDVLHAVEPQVGDCFFIPAGTVHALGGGLVVAEIQQSSNTTFRLFDWNRVDPSGRGRELHVREALAVTDFDRGPVQPQVAVAASDGLQTLVDCDRFVLRKAELASPTAGAGQLSEIRIGGDQRMRIVSVVRGSARLVSAGGPPLPLRMGQSTLVPASAGEVTLRAEPDGATLLVIQLPSDPSAG
jgi:mannose-6-phosphate isomerase